MSIKLIAEKAGVSISTVSRVLNNPDYKCSSDEIREKIWNIAMELNYTPNVAARNLKMGINRDAEKTYYLNVLMTRMNEVQTDPFFNEVLHIVESEIHKHMCILSNVWYMPIFSDDKKCRNTDLSKLADSMYKNAGKKCDGLIIIGKCNEDALKKLNEKYKNIVSINRNSTNYEVDEVLCDGSKIASIAVEYLISLGHKKIGYVGDCCNEARYRGYIDVLNKHNIDLNESYIISTKQTEVEGFEAMEALLKSGDMPTGIYCANDITAIGMLKCLNRHKNLLFRPAIISSDDIEEAQFTSPMLTTVRLPKEEMGKFALNILVDRMEGGHKSIVKTELECKLMIRDSCSEMR